MLFLFPRGLNVWRAHRSALRFRALAAMVVAGAGIGFLACGGSGGDSTGPGGGSSGGTASVVITPSAPTVNVGGQVSLTVQVLDASGAAVAGATVFWSSADTTIATVTSSGVVTGKAVGSTQIAASSGGKSAAVVVTVSPVPVASLVVLPSAVTLVIGGSVSLAAVASDANGNTLTGRPVTWASSSPSVATVDGTGKVTGVTAGTATVSATCEGKTASASVTITVIPVAAVSIVPGSAALNVGQSTGLTAITTDGNGNVLGGRPVTWTTGNAAVATVSNSGLVSAIGAGTTTITATAEGKSGTAQVVVTSVAPPPPIPVASVSVAPGTAGLNPGGTVILSATVRDSTGAVLTGRVVTWSTSASGVATVSASGVVTAVATGSAIITATSETKSGTAIVTVVLLTDPVATVTIAPSNPTMVQDSTLTFTATTADASGTVLTGRTVTWVSTNPTVATVGSTGLVTASHTVTGSTAITATSEGKSGVTAVTVILRPVATVTVSPATATVFVGNTTNLVDTTRDGHNALLTGRTVTWTSSNAAIATVAGSGGSGVVTATGVGTATITATSEGQSGNSVITVILVPVSSVTVSPSPASIAVGDSVTLVATPKDSAGHPLVGRIVTWSSSVPGTATVSSTGVVKGVAASATAVTITATSGGKSGTAMVTVVPVTEPVATVTVAPPNPTMVQDSTLTFTDTTKDGSGNVLTGRAVTWASSNPTVATVGSSTGLVTASHTVTGTTAITATSEGKNGATVVTVILRPVATVTVSPATATVILGNTTNLVDTTRDGHNALLTGRTVSWTSSNTAIATVAGSGGSAVVTATGVGMDTITATSEGKTGTSVITVTPVPVASVSVSPSAASITVGNTVTVTASPRDANNNPLSGRTVTWTSSAPRVASVPATGLSIAVTGDSAGTASIVATSEGKNSQPIVVTVTPAPVAFVSASAAATTLTVGGTTQMTSVEQDASHNALTGRVVRWSSGTPRIATVDSISGLVTALDSGTVSITATSETITGSASITVNLVPVASVALTATPDSAITVSAGTVTVTAQAFDASNNQLTGRAYTWASSAPTIATVSATGSSVTVTGAAGGINGTVIITVTCDNGVQNTVTITVSGQ